MSDKLTALVDSADGRHFFTYFREASIQRPFVRRGAVRRPRATPATTTSGSSPRTSTAARSTTGSIAPSPPTVQLHADGSAAVHLQRGTSRTARPPYTLPDPDPEVGYDTRYLGALIGVFLPRFVQLGTVSADGTPFNPFVRHPNTAGVLNRKILRRTGAARRRGAGAPGRRLHRAVRPPCRTPTGR